MGSYRNADTGETTFDTDYIGAWNERQNIYYRKELRARLAAGKAAHVVFQPGDGTRYEFLLIPDAPAISISNDGREPGMSMADGHLLRAVVLNGIGDGVGTFNRAYGDTMENARYRIEDKMSVPNPCTREALAATIFQLWYEGH